MIKIFKFLLGTAASSQFTFYWEDNDGFRVWLFRHRELNLTQLARLGGGGIYFELVVIPGASNFWVVSEVEVLRSSKGQFELGGAQQYRTVVSRDMQRVSDIATRQGEARVVYNHDLGLRVPRRSCAMSEVSSLGFRRKHRNSLCWHVQHQESKCSSHGAYHDFKLINPHYQRFDYIGGVPHAGLLVALVDDKLAMKATAALGPSSTSESYASS
ncbi:hypothetical protein Tco_0003153 [Tanacetum coccineum]